MQSDFTVHRLPLAIMPWHAPQCSMALEWPSKKCSCTEQPHSKLLCPWSHPTVTCCWCNWAPATVLQHPRRWVPDLRRQHCLSVCIYLWGSPLKLHQSCRMPSTLKLPRLDPQWTLQLCCNVMLCRCAKCTPDIHATHVMETAKHTSQEFQKAQQRAWSRIWARTRSPMNEEMLDWSNKAAGSMLECQAEVNSCTPQIFPPRVCREHVVFNGKKNFLRSNKVLISIMGHAGLQELQPG